MAEPRSERAAPADTLRRESTGSQVEAWLRRHERPLLVAIVVFQVAVLVGLIAVRVPILLIGETILLRVEPVDPRDPFRGQYVILDYDLWPAGGPDPGGGLGPGDRGRTVYVRLAPEADGVHWRAAGISTERPTAGRYLRGTYEGYNRVRFGIEAYYVQEGEGPRLERALRDGRVSAEVAVTAGGRAALRRLVVH